MNFMKQINMFDPDNDVQPNIHVYGIGSIGSHVVIGLVKTGFKNVTVYDMDVVEHSNLPAQFYDEESVDIDKTVNIKRIAKQFSGINLNTKMVWINDDFQPDVSINSVHIMCFDEIEPRKVVAEKLRKFPVYLIDGRIGGFNLEVYALKMNNDECVDKYDKSLEGEFSQLQCGDKCLWAVNSFISSWIIGTVICISKDNDFFFLRKSMLQSNHIISE